ncbi:hypothetical protein [Phyllobacterium sp. K27]
MLNVERDPEYVRDRIVETDNLGPKYLVSIGLCAALVVSVDIVGVYSPDPIEAHAVTSHHEVNQSSLKRAAVRICTIDNVNLFSG